jgi:predicted Rossmann-fold nucleotide-binding protein
MAAVSAAFAATPGRRGLVIGVLPAQADDPLRQPKEGYPNPFVEIMIATHLPLSGERGTEPLSRNHINVLSADAVIALPGGAGTRSEVELALRYGRPVIAHLARREDLAGLPAEVPLAPSLAEIGAFLRARLGPRWQQS